MTVEMLDPRWREQSRIAASRQSTTNLSTADVANNLKRLASQRSDVFDPITGQAFTEEEAARRKRAEIGEYAGASGSPAPVNGSGALPPGVTVGPPGSNAQDASRPTDIQEQLRQIQNKFGGQNG